MQDAKTGGSRWVPDIREDEITEFQEQNGDETATYKAVNVHPIISRVLDKLAFFRTHVSAVWYNKLANKTVKDKLDEIDTSISSLNSNLDSRGQFFSNYKKVAAIEGKYNDIVSLNLDSNSSYLILGQIRSDISEASHISANITAGIGNPQITAGGPTFSSMVSGGGTTVFAIVKTSTASSVILRSYGYYSGSYNIEGIIAAIRIS